MVRTTFLASLLLLSLNSLAEELSGTVEGITDGDTLTLLVNDPGFPGRKGGSTWRSVKIRLAEIDTPEKGQPWGNKARKALAKKVSRRL